MIKLRTIHSFFICISLLACENNEEIYSGPITDNIHYKVDGRSVCSGSPEQIELDIDNDGNLDFLTFTVLHADQDGDHLYFGIKPIANNMIKSSLPNENYYLDMGFIQSEEYLDIINCELKNDQIWTSGRNTLVLRHTESECSIRYEGSLQHETEEIEAIKLSKLEATNYGWLRFKFDKDSECITLIDYAYNLDRDAPIKAGQKD
ncbi:hypothetical protein KO529_14385 [Arenibacter algicola]|uniref:hypothetical protein n=1 Tax=Arenibacter algicola TaxID=616991 RepID=UPI001C076106|nr:hypothetical protein [Arenibacter algicola]MBU2905982.1 hypothetical protein [Arenibacter algicola]